VISRWPLVIAAVSGPNACGVRLQGSVHRAGGTEAAADPWRTVAVRDKVQASGGCAIPERG
jgi:hypothetical protein